MCSPLPSRYDGAHLPARGTLPSLCEEALDAVLVPRPQQVVDGRIHAAEAAIQQTLDGRYDSPPASAVPFGLELPQPHVRPRRCHGSAARYTIGRPYKNLEY